MQLDHSITILDSLEVSMQQAQAQKAQCESLKLQGIVAYWQNQIARLEAAKKAFLSTL